MVSSGSSFSNYSGKEMEWCQSMGSTERLKITVLQCLCADAKDPAGRKELMIPEPEGFSGGAPEKC